jgi:cytochrome P450
VLLSDPDTVRQVVQDRLEVWLKDGTAFFPGSALAGNGLLVSDGPLWRRQRRLTNPAFRQAAVCLQVLPVPALVWLRSLWLRYDVSQVVVV